MRLKQQMAYTLLMEDRMKDLEERLLAIESKAIANETPTLPSEKETHPADMILGLKRMNCQEYLPTNPKLVMKPGELVASQP